MNGETSNSIALIVIIAIIVFGGIGFSFWLEWQAKNGGKGDE